MAVFDMEYGKFIKKKRKCGKMRTIVFETRVKKWNIRVYERQYKTDKWVAGDVIGEWHGDSFIKYDRTDKDGVVAYDFPERLPKYLKNKVKSVLNMLQKEGVL